MKHVTHNEILRVKMTEEMFEAFKEYAYYEEEVTMSVIVRREIKRLLDEHNSNK